MKRKTNITTKINIHHIIPRFRCIELGIHPDDPVNDTVKVSQLDHANIHWEHSLGSTETLLSYCTPTQFQLDNLCLDDKRHIGGAVILAGGMIEGIDMSGENHYMWGKKHSPETLKKMSEALKGNQYKLGKKDSPETIKKKSESHKGENNPLYGKTHSPETLKKMGDAARGRVISPEWRKKISKSQKRRWEYRNYEEYEEMK